MINIPELKKADIQHIEEMIYLCEEYLNKKIGHEEIIISLNRIATLYDGDEYLNMFKGMWSEIDDIREEIKTGKNYFGDIKTTEKDLEDYINSSIPDIKEGCKVLVMRYEPVLKDLRNRFF